MQNYRMSLIGLGILLFSVFALNPMVQADTWHHTDNRIKGRTQQSHPIEPTDVFVTKPVKG